MYNLYSYIVYYVCRNVPLSFCGFLFVSRRREFMQSVELLERSACCNLGPAMVIESQFFSMCMYDIYLAGINMDEY